MSVNFPLRLDRTVRFLFMLVLVAIGIGQSALAQEIRPLRDYIIIYKPAIEAFPSLGVVPGVYLNPMASTSDRPDLTPLVNGGSWKAVPGVPYDITAGHTNGKIRAFDKEIWALSGGRYYMLINQQSVLQIIATGVPSMIIPAREGFFGIGKVMKPYYVTNQLKKPTDEKPSPAATTPEIRGKETEKGIQISGDDYTLSLDGETLLYVTKNGTLAKCKKATCQDLTGLKTDGGWAISREGIFSTMKSSSGKQEFFFTAMNADGSLKGSASLIYVLGQNESFKIMEGSVLIKRPKAENPNESFITALGPQGDHSEPGQKNRLFSPRNNDLNALKNLGADLISKASLGAYNHIVERTEYTTKIAEGFKGNKKTWVNVVGPLGSGTTSAAQAFLRGIQRQTLKEKDREFHGFSVFGISMGELIRQKATDQANQAQGVNEVKKFLDAAINKKVILYIDSFLDDPTLGATNVKTSLEEFLRLFRPNTESGQLLVMTSCTSEQWREVTESNPQLKEMSTVIEVGEPNRETLHQILLSNAKEMERTYNVKIEPNLIKDVMEFAKDISPAESEPRRSVRILENLVKQYGSTNSGQTNMISSSQAQEFFKNKIFNLQELRIDFEKIKAALDAEVIGHPEAKEVILSSLQNLTMGGVSLKGGPLATIFLIGPTGTGKTFTAEVLATAMGLPLVRVQMQNFVGFSPTLDYTQKIKRYSEKPFILLLDEMDKKSDGGPAPIDRFQKLRSVLEYGIWGLDTPEQLNLKSAILILTGNHAQSIILSNPTLSHSELLDRVQSFVTTAEVSKDGKGTPEEEKIASNVWSYLVSNTAIYKALSKPELAQVAATFAKDIAGTIKKEFKIEVIVSPRILQYVVERSYRDSLGVVPIKQQIYDSLHKAVRAHILANKGKAMTEVYVSLNASGATAVIDNSNPRYAEIKTKDMTKEATSATK